MGISVLKSADIVRAELVRDSALQRVSLPGDAKGSGVLVQQQMSNEAAAKLVRDIQEKIDSMNVSLTFSTYGRNNNIAITVSEKESGEVIREIPPKELQQLAEKLDEMIGLIFSKSA